MKRINLALQGGGAHGALTWGVLDRLLEDGRLAFVGVCGASAGAMNAVVLAEGLRRGGPEGARAALHDFWHDVSAAGRLFGPIKPWPDPLAPDVRSNLGVEWSYFLFESFTRLWSPYQFNPLGLHPLRGILERRVDFAALRRASPVQLFLSATHVRSGKIKVFKNPDLCAEAVLASACLPMLFQAVEVAGEHYWDGGYVGNPALFPLFYADTPRDLVIVHVNPIRRERVPTTPSEIGDRVNEISFNANLLGELRAIAFVQKIVREAWLKDEYRDRLRHVLVHSIRCDAVMRELSLSSKFSPDWRFLTRLRDRGRELAANWLERHYAALGERSTVDLKADFLD